MSPITHSLSYPSTPPSYALASDETLRHAPPAPSPPPTHGKQRKIPHHAVWEASRALQALIFSCPSASASAPTQRPTSPPPTATRNLRLEARWQLRLDQRRATHRALAPFSTSPRRSQPDTPPTLRPCCARRPCRAAASPTDTLAGVEGVTTRARARATAKAKARARAIAQRRPLGPSGGAANGVHMRTRTRSTVRKPGQECRRYALRNAAAKWAGSEWGWDGDGGRGVVAA